MKKMTLLVILMLLVLSVACTGRNITEGYAQEYISFVEQQKNGNYQIRLRYDNVASYCFNDDAMYEKAKWFIDHYPDGISKIHYMGIFKGDPLYQDWYEVNTGCATMGTTSEGGGTYALKLMDFCIMEPQKVLGEDTPREYYCDTIPAYLLPKK